MSILGDGNTHLVEASMIFIDMSLLRNGVILALYKARKKVGEMS